MRNVLILGATSAIAAEVAKLYAASGDRLYLVGRSPEKLDALVAELGAVVVLVVGLVLGGIGSEGDTA